MRITIITPSFNQGEFIEQTILSVMKQNHNDVEHIIIDGGSTDNTVSILKKYPHLKWISEKDSGQSNAINKGFKIATGDILAWLNSDDYYDENVFGDIVRYFESNPRCNLLYGDITFVDRKGHVLSRITGDIINYNKLIECPDIVRQPSFFWRHEVLTEVGGLDENLHLVMDFDFFLRVATQHRFHYYNENFSYYRFYEQNKSLSMVRRQIIEIFKVYKKNNVKLDLHILEYLTRKYLQSFRFRNHIRNGIYSLLGHKKTK